jgi:hypothetical protein
MVWFRCGRAMLVPTFSEAVKIISALTVMAVAKDDDGSCDDSEDETSSGRQYKVGDGHGSGGGGRISGHALMNNWFTIVITIGVCVITGSLLQPEIAFTAGTRLSPLLYAVWTALRPRGPRISFTFVISSSIRTWQHC